MTKLRDAYIKKFEQLPGFEHATWEPREFNRIKVEEEVRNRLARIGTPNVTFSELLVGQLIELCGKSFVDICGENYGYILSDVFFSLENIILGKRDKKPFLKKSSFLFGKNIFHSHHAHTHYMKFNLVRYFNRMFKTDADIESALADLKKEYPGRNDYDKVFAIRTFNRSLVWEGRTGEWIIFQLFEDKLHFVCLYVHNYGDDKDRRLYDFIKDHLAT